MELLFRLTLVPILSWQAIPFMEMCVFILPPDGAKETLQILNQPCHLFFFLLFFFIALHGQVHTQRELIYESFSIMIWFNVWLFECCIELCWPDLDSLKCFISGQMIYIASSRFSSLISIHHNVMGLLWINITWRHTESHFGWIIPARQCIYATTTYI